MNSEIYGLAEFWRMTGVLENDSRIGALRKRGLHPQIGQRLLHDPTVRQVVIYGAHGQPFPLDL